MATGVHPTIRMELQIVIMPGSHRVDLPLVRGAAHEYGWTIHTARNVQELTGAAAHSRIGAVFFQQDSIGSGGSWIEAIALLRSAVPGVRLVACSEFSSGLDYPKLCRAGLFHSVWLPLKSSEVKQCLGFIWEAEKRRAASPLKSRAAG
jgi:hypothetical protein